MVIIDKKRAEKIGELLSQVCLKNTEKKELNKEEKEYELLFNFIAMVICHQINWNFLESALRKIPKDQFNSKALENINSYELHGLLKDYHKPERILSEERAKMIQEFCNVLNEKYTGSILKLLKESENSVVKLRKNLDVFKAFFEDPLRKKSNILIQVLFRAGLVDFKDINKVNPAIDDHLIRLALRNGRLKLDEDLNTKVIEEKEITAEEDELIREKTIESFRISTEKSSKTIPETNLIEWHIARSFCVRDNPKCECNENPLVNDLEFEFKAKCPLFESCEKLKEYKKEPIFKTSFN